MSKEDYIDAIIRVKVPKWQIGQEAQVFFPDTMSTRGICEDVTSTICSDYDGATLASGSWD